MSDEVDILLAILDGCHYPCNESGCSHLASHSVSVKVDPIAHDYVHGPKPTSEAAVMLWELNEKMLAQPRYHTTYRCKRHAQAIPRDSATVSVEERSFARHIERLDAILHKGDI
jgi:hypothetical protein